MKRALDGSEALQARPSADPPRLLHALEPQQAPADDAIGRSAELARLRHFVEDSDEPALLLGGPRGSGRSFLLRALHRRYPDRTLMVRSHVGSSAPWTGLTAVLGAVDVAAPDAHREPDRQSSGTAVRSAGVLIDALQLAGSAPAVVLIDDVDLQDDERRSTFDLLVEQLTGSPLRLVAGVTWPLRSGRRATAPVLRLDPMSESDLLRIVPTLTDRGVDPVTAALLARTSGGVPGVLAAHLARLTPSQRAGRAPLTLPPPPAYPDEAPIAASRYGLDAEDRRLLQRIATAPAVSAGALGALVGASAGRVERLLARGLLARENGFVSVPTPELRSLLYWDMAPDDRVEAHADAADAEESSDPDLRDWHASHVAPDASTPPSLYAAATSMLRKDSSAAAIELAERALALTSVALPVLPQLEFVRELVLGGSAGLARRHLPGPRAAMTRRQAFQRAALDLTLSALGDGDPNLDSVDALVGRYRAELPEECAELLALAGVLLLLAGDLEEGLRRIAAADSIATPVQDDPRLHAWATRLGAAVAGRPDAGPVVRVPGDVAIETRLTHALTMLWEERHPEARESFAAILGGARKSLWNGHALAFAAKNEFRAGDFTHGLELVRRIEQSPGERTQHERVLIVWAALAEGRLDDADANLAVLDATLIGRRHGQWAHEADRLRAWTALQRGDLETAVDRLKRVVHAVPDLNPAVLRCHSDLVETQWRIGDLTGAADALARFSSAAEHTSARWTQLALLRSRALLDEDVRGAFDAALLAFESHDAPFEKARTHAVYARAARRAGMHAVATEQRLIAVETLRRIGAGGWAHAEGEATAPSAAPGRHGLPVLTDSELAVLRMARRGAHNREIATALFLSLRTVELRLTQIYRKFGARSRAHLFTLLPEDWPDAGGGSRRP